MVGANFPWYIIRKIYKNVIMRKDSLGRHCRHCGAFVSVRTAQACSLLLIVEPDIVSQCDVSNPYFAIDTKLKPPKVVVLILWSCLVNNSRTEIIEIGQQIKTFKTIFD